MTKRMAVGILKVVDGVEKIGFGVVLEEKNHLFILQRFSYSCGTADGSALHSEHRLSQMLEVHFWSDSESPHGHWRWAVLCDGSWFKKQAFKKDCVSLCKQNTGDWFKFFFGFQFHTCIHFHFIVYIDAISLHVFLFFCMFFSCMKFVIPQVFSAFKKKYIFNARSFVVFRLYNTCMSCVFFFSRIALVIYGMLFLCLFLADCIDFKALMHVLCNFVIALVIECVFLFLATAMTLSQYSCTFCAFLWLHWLSNVAQFYFGWL